ncbi:10870_t:CDS:1, partial [Rhizophagus irregularis]
MTERSTSLHNFADYPSQAGTSLQYTSSSSFVPYQTILGNFA